MAYAVLTSGETGANSLADINANFALAAPLASPTFTGILTAPATVISSSTGITGSGAQLKVIGEAASLYGAKMTLDATPATGGDNWSLLSSTTAAGEGAGAITLTNITNTTTAFSINRSGIFTTSIKPPNSAGTAVFALDTSGGTPLTIADNGTATPFGGTNNFAGLIHIHNQTSGETALFLTSANTMVLVSQVGTAFTITVTSAGKVNVYLVANVVTIENKKGSSQNFLITAIRTKTST